jgi:regulator of protease activity HflC (stomatin/prohibitin superfamily)
MEAATATVTALIAAEIFVRCVAALFLPLPPNAERQSPADSALAALISAQVLSLSAANAALAREFGLDLSRSWALRFVKNAAAFMVAGLALGGWLVTGLSAVRLNERAVYEEFGRPVAVVGPGLHLHLPWPFGVVRRIEFGVLHEIPVLLPPDSEASGANRPLALPDKEEIVSAESEPPPSADRLWSAVHPWEASYLVASDAGGSQNFEIVDIDVRVIYRIGLSDPAALAAAYSVADPARLVRAEAGRILSQHCAGHTVSYLLGENRAAFIRSFRAQLQSRLHRLDTGLEIVGVVVEAIHPPPDAASAYHAVQAARIQSLTRISRSRAAAAAAVEDAQRTATGIRNAALAATAERVDEAQAADLLFTGDFTAYVRGGQAFLYERWLDRVAKNLAGAPLVVVDHRLTGHSAPTIDLRQFGGGTAAEALIPPRDRH